MTFTLTLDVSQITDDITVVASKVIRKITYDVHATIIDRIRLGPKTGRTYRRRTKSGRIRFIEPRLQANRRRPTSGRLSARSR